jgi:hypothetical protein
MILGLVMATSLMANGNQPIKGELEDKLSLNLNEYEFHDEYQDFVVVSFVVVNQKIQINEIMGSDEWLINSVRSELSKMDLDNFYPSGQTYSFKFVFSKR